jgi:hypothetical protein
VVQNLNQSFIETDKQRFIFNDLFFLMTEVLREEGEAPIGFKIVFSLFSKRIGSEQDLKQLRDKKQQKKRQKKRTV